MQPHNLAIMFIQAFRNKVYECRSLKYRIRKLDRIVASQLSESEPSIVKALSDGWSRAGPIDLGSFSVAGTDFHLWLDFRVRISHGAPFVKVADVSLSSGKIEYETEFGDLALIVNYILDGQLLQSKISVLQTKKEEKLNNVKIQLHQQYLMQFWPDILFRGNPQPFQFHMSTLNPDEFAFYHFILNSHSNSSYSSSLCSAPFIGEVLRIDRKTIEKELMEWNLLRASNKTAPPPFTNLSSLSLEPGGIYRHGKSYEWNLIPKPLTQLLLDAAYLNVGTENRLIIKLAHERIGTILQLNVGGGKGRGMEYSRDVNDYDRKRNDG
jgi:hypothetical protein